MECENHADIGQAKREDRGGNMLEHLIRHDSYIQTVLEGRMEGRLGRGRPRQSFTDQA